MLGKDERLFAAKALRRAVLAAYDRLIDAGYRRRRQAPYISLGSEKAIEAEAVRVIAGDAKLPTSHWGARRR
jgi:hypothetical protein